MKMLRFAWATALATLLVLALNLTLLDPANHTASCAQLELEFESEDFKRSIPEAPASLSAIKEFVIGKHRHHLLALGRQSADQRQV